jgi:hypothetical protein
MCECLARRLVEADLDWVHVVFYKRNPSNAYALAHQVPERRTSVEVQSSGSK